MVSCFGTIQHEDGGLSTTTEDQAPTMSNSTHCFEIVQLAFQAATPPVEQSACMRVLGAWVAGQPGFVSRQCFHDAQAQRWTDIVEWESAPHAQAAMARSQHETALAGVMALIDPTSLQVGHGVPLG